jgi:hypothetical protein
VLNKDEKLISPLLPKKAKKGAVFGYQPDYFLLLMTMIGVSAMQKHDIARKKMAGKLTGCETWPFQAAESGLRDTENYLF